MGAYTRKDKADDGTQDFERVFDLFPRLKERHKQVAGTMSGGEQQMLAIGRALMARPQAAAARRAVDGPGAEADPADLRRSSPRSPSRARRSWSSSRTPSRRSRVPTAATSSRPARSSSPAPGSDLLDDPSIREAYLGVA